MNFDINLQTIPGTILKRADMGNASGEDFLDKIFFVTDGIMLAQVREISGVDGTTLQNWVKRGWVENPKNKRYNKDQLARILIINMMRSTMQLARISFLLRYINGAADSREDDIIPESKLYGYICRILDSLVGEAQEGAGRFKNLRENIEYATADYIEKFSGARRRLNNALEIIIESFYASILIAHTEELMKQIEG